MDASRLPRHGELRRANRGAAAAAMSPTHCGDAASARRRVLEAYPDHHRRRTGTGGMFSVEGRKESASCPDRGSYG
jgi:hypothetical protein